ncbi:hypothetical protein K458DRAFT_415546 [Lentithecium fluviatile CBS 122367]|uniref:Uncharacterized protein n=1 Tax=Lentithecium fluviatile CBS 122367 TaxID=1168545 RepID=A0A6G1JAX2_9PLEO|nr:hypothetical protein K458DRAFT_415546 [Lentithecium fluviatile CBS 122367]
MAIHTPRKLERSYYPPLSTIVAWERDAHMSLNFQNAPRTHPGKNRRARWPLACEQPDTHFWTMFFDKLPKEMRDLVYEYVLGSTKSTYTVQHDGSVFRYIPRKCIRPLQIFPRYLNAQEADNRNGRELFIEMFHAELAALLFSINTFYFRYRYTPFLLEFLTRPFQHTSCIPVQHLRHITIILARPESAEDSSDDFEESEFEWEALFPRPRNAKCGMFKERLVEVFEGLGRVLMEEECGVREVSLVVSEWVWGDERAAFGEWLKKCKDDLGGKRMKVRVVWLEGVEWV